MTILNEQDSLLLVIDVQEKLLNAVFNKDALENKSITMVKAAKILNIPIVVTEQYPKGLGATKQSLQDILGDGFKYFEKTSFSAMDNSSISESINKSNKKQVIIFGIETHICVSQTVNALLQKGYDVTVIADACGSRSELEHIAGLSRIEDNGAHIITAEIALFEWLKTSKHENFQAIQNLIK